jgi:sugar phosphate isomerase/epimerase
MKLGVITDCFKQDLNSNIVKAKNVGVKGIQVYAVSGEFCPENLTEDKINDFIKTVKENNLVVSALCGDLGGHGFEIEEDNEIKIEKSKKIIDLANRLNVGVVTTHIGVIPENDTNPRYLVMLKALKTLGDYAISKGVTLAIETGPENAKTLYSFVNKAGAGVGVNLDPANFKMVTDQDPAEAVYLLKDKIVHTHLKDGVMLKKTDPKIIYDHFASGGIEALNVADYFLETPIGEGSVDFKAYFKALEEIGYNGFLTIERETGKNPENDILKAVNFVKDNFPNILD